MRNTLKEMDHVVTNDEHKFATTDIAFYEAVVEVAQNGVLFELLLPFITYF
jgi:DNA-binding FadR family transcriptional regulator